MQADAKTTKYEGSAVQKDEGISARLSPVGILGTVISLMGRSPAHRHLFIGDLDWWLVPALRHGQFRIFHDGKREIGFALWAKVSAEVDAELAKGTHKLRPADWTSGNQLWLMELVVPTANPKGLHALLGQLLKGPFKGQKFKMHLQDEKTGKLRSVVLGPKTPDEELKAVAKEKGQH